MADVTIDAAVKGDLNNAAQRAGPFWTSPTVGYVFYCDAVSNLVWRKTVDGGANWGGANVIVANFVAIYDCWADWQTEGDAGTLIHIAVIDCNTAVIGYINLDTSDDSVSALDTIEAASVQGTGEISPDSYRGTNYISLTKTRGGNLAVAFVYTDAGDFTRYYGFYTSPDGDTWTSRATPWEGVVDIIELFPANLTDNQDLWGAFWDRSTNEIDLKTFDNSGNSWATQNIAGSMEDVNFYMHMSGAIRLSDGHLILAAWSEYDNANADLMVWDITDAGTITAKTNVLTNKAEGFFVSILINQDNDDIYVAYFAEGFAQVWEHVQYQISQDGGANWDGQVQFSSTTDDYRWISAGAVKAVWGGKFQPIFLDQDDQDLFTNEGNGISIAAAGVGAETYDETGKEQVVLAVQDKGEQFTEVEAREQTVLGVISEADLATFADAREQVVLAVAGESDLATWNELNKLLAVLVVQEGWAGTHFEELDREQVILAVVEKVEQLIKVETREQVVLAVPGESDLVTFLETLKLQTILGIVSEIDLATFQELNKLLTVLVVQEGWAGTRFEELDKEQVVLAVIEKVEQLIKVESREQVMLGVIEESDLVTFLETLKSQTILAVMEAIAGFLITETEREQIVLAIISGDAISRGVLYEELRTQVIRAVVGKTEQLTYTESLQQVILAIQALRSILIVQRIRRIIPGYTLGRVKPTPHNLGTMQDEYTLGKKRR